MIRIAKGGASWWRPPELLAELVESLPADVLLLDPLDEAAFVKLVRQRRSDASRGFVEEFPAMVERLVPLLKERGVRLVTEAGGANPVACARELRRRAPGLKVAAVYADATQRVEELLAKGDPLTHASTGAAIGGIREHILMAAAPIEAAAIAQALATGADVVITGWPAGPALALGPALFHFNWQPADWPRLAAGVIAGHLLGAAGGAGLITPHAQDGCPIAELFEDGCLELAGWASVHAVKLALLAGVADPRLETPDCVADLARLELEAAGEGRVRIHGAWGGPPTETTTLYVAWAAGWKVAAGLLYCWPDAFEKARAADRLLRRRLARAGAVFDEIHAEYVGVNACLGAAAPPVEQHPEVELRVGARSRDRDAVEQLARELAAVAAVTSPCWTSFSHELPRIEEAVALWPVRLPRGEVPTRIETVP